MNIDAAGDAKADQGDCRRADENRREHADIPLSDAAPCDASAHCPRNVATGHRFRCPNFTTAFAPPPGRGVMTESARAARLPFPEQQAVSRSASCPPAEPFSLAARDRNAPFRVRREAVPPS